MNFHVEYKNPGNSEWIADGNEYEFFYTLAWNCDTIENDYPDGLPCPPEWNDQVCDTSCEFTGDKILYMLPSSTQIPSHDIYREFEPDIFFPQDPYTSTDAFRIDLEDKCAIGGGSLSSTI